MAKVPFAVHAARTIAAAPETVYGIIADYRHGHPGILPPQFGPLHVARGGVGAGTRIHCSLRVFGRMQPFEAEISEPEPGRVLVERVVTEPMSTTTFTVEHTGDGRSQVTIVTELTGGTGVAGAIERFLTRRLLRPIYAAELELLAKRAAAQDVA